MANQLDLEEQEQLDQLKHFWSQYGNLITWLLIVVLGSVAAWNGYQYWQRKQAAQAAALFDEMGKSISAGDMAMAQRTFSDMKERYPGTAYAQQAALLAARVYQDKDRKADAKVQLTWVIDKASDDGYKALARLRLAALLIEDKAYDEARKQLTAQTPESFAPLMADRLGDLAMLQTQRDEAVHQYQKAWKGLEPTAEYRRLVAVKLAALGADPEDKSQAESNK